MNQEEISNDDAVELSRKIIETIKKTRKEKGLSQADVAEACGIPQPTYSELERGKQDFPLTRLLKVMKFLNIKAFDEPAKEEDKEDVAIVIKPEEIGDYFRLLIMNDMKQQQDISDIKQMLQELLKNKDNGMNV